MESGVMRERNNFVFAVNIGNYRIPPPPQNAPGGDQVRLNDLVTPMQRRNFDGLKIRNSLGEFPESVRHTAREDNVPLIDLEEMSIAFYEALGPEKSPLAFSGGRDVTHHSAYGACALAKCIVEGVRANKFDFARFIVKDYKPFDPAHPDPPERFDVPASPGSSNVAPGGD